MAGLNSGGMYQSSLPLPGGLNFTSFNAPTGTGGFMQPQLQGIPDPTPQVIPELPFPQLMPQIPMPQMPQMPPMPTYAPPPPAPTPAPMPAPGQQKMTGNSGNLAYNTIRESQYS